MAIPAFNAQNTIEEAIASVLIQSYRDISIVVLDDGSTDKTVERARLFADERIKVISDGVNRGLVYRLNQAIRLCASDYLARMDADDLMHPERIERQVSYLEQYRLCQVVGSSAYIIDAECRARGVRWAANLSDVSLRDIVARCPFIHPSVTGRVEWFLANQYDSRFVRAEDRELWIRGFRPGIFHNMPECLLFYREMGCFRLSAYRKSCCTDRRIIRSLESLGEGARLIHLAKSYVKELCYCSCAGVGCVDWLLLRRSSKISQRQANDAQEAIERIKAACRRLSA